MIDVESTLGYIIQDGKLLLGMKKRGFGAGRWNGFGGKIMPPESVTEGLVREFEEEVGVTPVTFEKRGEMTFHFQKEAATVKTVHIFAIVEFTGTPQESEEMAPTWFPLDNLPYADMWKSDVFWFPVFLSGKTFRGTCTFSHMGGEVVSHTIDTDVVY